VSIVRDIQYNVRNNRVIIIRLHRSTTHVDVTYCNIPSSVVCGLVSEASTAKTAEPIEMPFELRTWVGPRKHY